MSNAALDRWLAILIAALLATGFATWRAGSSDTAWVYVLHGILAGGLLAASALKVKRSLPRVTRGRRWGRLLVALPLIGLCFLSLGAGFVWVAGGRLIDLGPWTLLGWHGILALALLPLLVVHLAPRRWRVLKVAGTRSGRPISRRALLGTGGLAVAGLAVWGVAGVADLVGRQPRRFTGSRWLPAGGVPIPTTFFGEGTPTIDPASWRLLVKGAVERELDLSLDELGALGGTELTAVLDCTGGWAMESTWSGVPMSALLEAAGVKEGAQRVDVRSVTGWAAGLSMEEASGTFLATGVSGMELPAGNGAPCRLVVPQRRGLDWVKWVTEVSIS